LTESVTDTQTHAHIHTQVNLYSVHAAYVVMRCLSVCLTVCMCPSRSWIVSKWIKMSSKCRWGRQKSRFWAYNAICRRCNRRGVINMVADGTRPPSRKLWHLYRWSFTAGIRPPSATRDKVTVSVVL